MDTSGTDSEKLKAQIKTIEERRSNLIELYMSGGVTREEYAAARAKCDNEIAELQSVIDSAPKCPGKCSGGAFGRVDKQREIIEEQQKTISEITAAINELVNGVEYEDDFYKEILDKMVVIDKDNIDVYLNLLPLKWSFRRVGTF